MGFVAVKCPNCGAEVNLDESREFGFCTYCGTKIAQEKIVVEHRGQVSVDGISTKASTLERANIYLAQGDFEKAKEYYSKVLDLDPKDADCYWKLLLCRKRVTENSALIQLYLDHPYGRVEFVDYPEYKNALQFANDDERKEYLAVIQRIDSIRPSIQKQTEEQIKSKWQAEREQIEAKYGNKKQRIKQVFFNWRFSVFLGIVVLMIVLYLTGALSK